MARSPFARRQRENRRKEDRRKHERRQQERRSANPERDLLKLGVIPEDRRYHERRKADRRKGDRRRSERRKADRRQSRGAWKHSRRSVQLLTKDELDYFRTLFLDAEDVETKS